MQTIILTGSSSGIGFATVHKLLAHNYRVIALHRNLPPHFEPHPNLYFVECELADPMSVNRAVSQIISLCHNQCVIALVNNAGYGQYGPLEDLERSDFERQMAVNFHGPLQLTNQLMPILRESKARILIVTSVLGFTSTPLRGAYSASKYALEAIADTWRLELASSGIKTILIEPGPVKTQFRTTASGNLQKLLLKNKDTYYKNQYEKFINQKKETKGTVSSEYVANIIYTAITAPNPKVRYRICTQTSLAWIGKRLLPSKIFDYIMLKNKS